MRLTTFGAALGCGLVLLFASVNFAQEPKLPEGLRHVPPDALGFLHFRVADFRKTEAGKLLMEELLKDREAAKGLKQIKKELGIDVADVVSVTVLILTPPLDSDGGFGPRRGPMYYDKKPAYDPPVPKTVIEKIVFDKTGNVITLRSPAMYQSGSPNLGGPQSIMVNEMRMMGGLVMVTSSKAFDRKAILKAQLFSPRFRDPYSGASSPSVLFLSDYTVMLGAPWDLGRYSEAAARKPKTAPLQSALALGAKPHLVVAGGQLAPEIRRMMFTPFGRDMHEIAPIAPLLQTEAGLTLDLGKTLDLTLQFTAPTNASAANALEAAKTLRVLGELALEKSQEAGEAGGWKLDLEKGLAKGLKEVAFQREGKMVTAQFKMDVTSKLVKHFTKDIVANLRIKGDRTTNVNNLKQIGLALHTYHDAYKRLPPAGIHSINDPNGKPLLSWHVAILPYLELNELYRQFDLTQPWDHPANKKLIARMPAIYVVPGTENKRGETNYRVLVGPTTMFEPMPGNRGIRLIDTTDGTSNTIMAVEASQPTIWTRPDDLPFDPKGPLPKFGTSRDGFNVLMGDGTVRYLRATTPESTLRAMITRNGGEVIELPDDR